MARAHTNGGRALRDGVCGAAIAVLAACGGGGGGVSSGVDVAAVAARQPPSQSASCSSITHLQVPVTAVRFGTHGSEVSRTFDPPRTIDLMAPQPGIFQSLGLAPLAAADPPQVRLTTNDGTVEFSSGATAVLKVPGGVTVSAPTQPAAGQMADLVVPAFDPCTAVHAAGNSGQWLLTGNVAAQLRTLPFSTTSPQIVAGTLRPLPGGGYAIVQVEAAGVFAVQRFDSFGNALDAAPVTITVPVPAGGSMPTVTPLVSGYLTTWLGATLNPQQPMANDYPLFAQLLDASGQPIGPAVQVGIATPTVSREVPSSTPQAAALPDGGAALVWARLQSGSHDVFLQRFSATGLLGSPQQVNTTTAQGLPNVVGQDNGNVLVVWGSGTLFARVFAPDGTAGPQQTIAQDALSLSGIPAVSPAPGGGAAVAWEAQVASGVVFFVRLGADGAPVAPAQPVTTVPVPPAVAPGQSSPSVGVLADGSSVIAWVVAGQFQVQARRFAADATPLGAAQVISGSHSVAPVVVPLSWGGFLIEVATPGGSIATLFDAMGLVG